METQAQFTNSPFELFYAMMKDEQSQFKFLNEYQAFCKKVTSTYGPSLQSQLDDIYEQYFKEDQIQPLWKYLIKGGVKVSGEDFPGVHGTLHLFMTPVRFEFISKDSFYKFCLWKHE